MIEQVMAAVASLAAHPSNYNRHAEPQIKDLMASLRRFGQRKPIVTWRGMILAGHGLVEAARRLSWSEVWIAPAPETWSEAEARAYLAADNELPRAADPDQDALAALVAEVQAQDAELAQLAAGGDAALKRLLAQPTGDDPGPQVDKAAELQEKWQVKPGDCFQLGDHRLICGDCTDAAVVARVMGGEKAECTIADPPYGVGIDYGEKTDDTRQNTLILAECVIPLLARTSDMVFWVSGGIKLLPWYYVNLPPLWIVAWYKGSPGHNSAIGFNDWEAVLVYGRRKNVQMHDYCDIRPSEAMGTYGHPVPKPVEWAEWFIQRASGKAGIVADPFLGSGTTLIACEKLGRRCRAVEIEPKYVAVALERWSQMTGKTPVLLAAVSAHPTQTETPRADGA